MLGTPLCTNDYDDQTNEFKHYRDLGCWEDDGQSSDLSDWVSPPDKEMAPRYCYLQCKTRGFRYFGVAGGVPRCSCGNSYGNKNPRGGTFQPTSIESCKPSIECDYGDSQGGLDACGVGWVKALYEITECSYSHVHFGNDAKFESPHLCWKEESGPGSDRCRDGCVPPPYLHEKDVQKFRQQCPQSICEYYRQNMAIGDHINKSFKDGSNLHRRWLRRFVDTRVENALLVMSVGPLNPVGYFNIQVGGSHQQITDDPEDPVFYSTCYKSETKRDFTNGAKYSPEPPRPLDYKVGSYCLECDSLTRVRTAWDSNEILTWWNTTHVCSACT